VTQFVRFPGGFEPGVVDVLEGYEKSVMTIEGVEYPNMGPIDQYPVDAGRLRKVIELVLTHAQFKDVPYKPEGAA
jgi:hypothetical protein